MMLPQPIPNVLISFLRSSKNSVEPEAILIPLLDIDPSPSITPFKNDCFVAELPFLILLGMRTMLDFAPDGIPQSLIRISASFFEDILIELLDIFHTMSFSSFYNNIKHLLLICGNYHRSLSKLVFPWISVNTLAICNL